MTCCLFPVHCFLFSIAFAIAAGTSVGFVIAIAVAIVLAIFIGTSAYKLVGYITRHNKASNYFLC